MRKGISRGLNALIAVAILAGLTGFSYGETNTAYIIVDVGTSSGSVSNANICSSNGLYVSADIGNINKTKISINYTLEKSGKISLNIYDIKGKMVKKLAEGNTFAGNHQITWNGTDLWENPAPTGVFLISFKVGSDWFKEKVTFLR